MSSAKVFCILVAEVAFDSMNTFPIGSAGYKGLEDDAGAATPTIGTPRPEGYQVYDNTPIAARQLPKSAQDDDDASLYSHVDVAGDEADEPPSSYYRQSQLGGASPTLGYLMPSRPLPAFDRSDATHSSEHLVISPSSYANRDLDRSRSFRSVDSGPYQAYEHGQGLYEGLHR